MTLGTNGTIDKARALLDARPDEVLFALDGASTETLAHYRRGAAFDRVLHNLDVLMRERVRANGSAPRVILQFVVMRQNESEVPRILEIARDFGVDEVSFVPVIVNDFFQADHARLLEAFLPIESPVVQYKRRGEGYRLRRPGICNWAFQSTVLYNGDVVICCFDYDGRHVAGNAFRDGGFLPVWRGARYRALRRGILSRSLPLCQQCGYSLVKPERIVLSGHHRGPAPGAYERWSS
ncbi:MAG: SPASM domain-containing protein [Candidatus Eisenbacteria bacterium]